MTQIIKRNGTVLCTSTVPYPREVLRDMIDNGLTVYQDGKQLARKDIKCESD